MGNTSGIKSVTCCWEETRAPGPFSARYGRTTCAAVFSSMPVFPTVHTAWSEPVVPLSGSDLCHVRRGHASLRALGDSDIRPCHNLTSV